MSQGRLFASFITAVQRDHERVSCLLLCECTERKVSLHASLTRQFVAKPLAVCHFRLAAVEKQ